MSKGFSLLGSKKIKTLKTKQKTPPKKRMWSDVYRNDVPCPKVMGTSEWEGWLSSCLVSSVQVFGAVLPLVASIGQFYVQ